MKRDFSPSVLPQDRRKYTLFVYDYVRYPCNDSTKVRIKQLVNAYGLVQKDYVLLADNDDFYLLEAIPEVLVVLETNNLYVGARGQHANLSLADESAVTHLLPRATDISPRLFLRVQTNLRLRFSALRHYAILFESMIIIKIGSPLFGHQYCKRCGKCFKQFRHGR